MYQKSYGNYERGIAQAIADELQSRQDYLGNASGSGDISRSTYQNLGTDSAFVVKAVAGRIFALTIYNKSEFRRYIQLYNSNKLPVSKDTPTESYPVFAGAFVILDSNYFGQSGTQFNSGITFGLSSEVGRYVAPMANDFEFHLKYT
jgi:hypothetical protein